MTSGVCLVTGGAGFIGCALSHLIAPLYSRVIVVDSLHPQIHADGTRPSALNSKAELNVGDVCDSAMWDRLLSDTSPDTIIHLASETGTGQSLTEAVRHSHVNVTGTSTMLDALTRRQQSPRRFVLVSSRAVYGEGNWLNTLGQTFHPGARKVDQLARGKWDFEGVSCRMAATSTQANPVSIYGATKLAQEHITRCWVAAHDSEVVILRLQNVYGPGQSLINSYTGILPLFCRIARSGQSIPLFEDGEMLRDFVHVEDVAEAIRAAVLLERPIQNPFDIGAGECVTIRQVAEIIATSYGAPPPHVCGKFRVGDVRHAVSDISEAMTHLNWRPRWQIAEGLGDLIKWVNQQFDLEACA